MKLRLFAGIGSRYGVFTFWVLRASSQFRPWQSGRYAEINGVWIKIFLYDGSSSWNGELQESRHESISWSHNLYVWQVRYAMSKLQRKMFGTAIDRYLLSVPRTIDDATERYAFVAILALGAVLRCATLGHDSLWIDEGYTLGVSRFPFSHLWTVPFDVHPPLFYSFVKASLLFGENESVLRSTSAIASTLTLIPFYMLARALMGRTGGLVAMAFLAMAFTNLVFASEARNYALLGLFLVIANAALHCLVRVLTAKVGLFSRDVLIPIGLYCLGALGALYTHNSAIVYLFVANAVWCLYAMVRPTVGGIAISFKLAAVNIPPLLLFLPWLKNITSTSDDFAWLSQASPFEALAILLVTVLPNEVTPIGALAALVVLGAGSLIALQRGGDLALVIGLNLVLFPLAVWLFGFVYKPIYMERVILPAIYGAALAIGAVAAYLRNTIWTIGLTVSALTLALLSSVAFLLRDSDVNHIGGQPRMNFRGALESVSQSPNSALVLCGFFSYPVAEFYAPGVDTYASLPDQSILPIDRHAWSSVFQLRQTERPDSARRLLEQSAAAGVETLPDHELFRRYSEIHFIGERLLCDDGFHSPMREALLAAGYSDVTEEVYAGVIARKFVRPDVP